MGVMLDQYSRRTTSQASQTRKQYACTKAPLSIFTVLRPTDVFDVDDSMSLPLSATCICFACDHLSYSTETWPEADCP